MITKYEEGKRKKIKTKIQTEPQRRKIRQHRKKKGAQVKAVRQGKIKSFIRLLVTALAVSFFVTGSTVAFRSPVMTAADEEVLV